MSKNQYYKINKISSIALALIFLFSLGNVQGFNGRDEKGRGKEEIRKERGAGSGAPSMPHQPQRGLQGGEQPPLPGGYTKPPIPEHRHLPKLDAVKPPAARKPGDGYSKPSAPLDSRQSKPDTARPAQEPKPPARQTGTPSQTQSKPPTAGEPQKQRPKQQLGQDPRLAPGASGAPPHAIQPHSGSGHGERPTPQQVQDFLKHHKPQTSPPNRLGLGKIGAATVGGVAGAIALDHFVNRDKSHTPRGPIIDHHPSIRHSKHDDPPYNAGQIRESYSHRYHKVFDEPWMMHHSNLQSYYWHGKVWPQRPWDFWWRPPKWILLTSWIPWNWSNAFLYDYGRNFYYDHGYVILNGQRLCRADEYYMQDVTLVSNIPPSSDDPEQWMPLGVFALKPAESEASDMILQMAVNKDGIIEGTYYNASEDIAKPIRGIVEKKSRRAVWTFSDDRNHSVILETGIYNLILDETKVLVHFGKHRTEEWFLVRLKEPQS